MSKLKSMIERIFTKKNIKIFLFVFIILWFFLWSSFAASDSSSKMSLESELIYLVNIMISILSRLWVLLATLAGKLMTNELVYWSFMNMDQVLWNLWNVVKNLANFTLWFLLIFTIVKNIFGVVKDDAKPLKNAIDTIKNLLIAGVLVQMSWFLVWAAFDLSAVATAAVGSIPSQIISNDTSNLQRNMKELIWSKYTKLKVDFSQSDTVKAIKTWEMTEDDVKQFVDMVTPSANSVIWPLIFLWGSVFDLFEASDTSRNTSNATKRSDLFLTIWVNWFVVLTFTVMLAFMFLFNLFRVITLWIVIPLSPFIILLKVFDPQKSKLKNLRKPGSFWDVLSLWNVLKLIFKPVYMVLVLSIILIVMTLVKWVAKHNDWDLHADTYNIDMTTKAVWSWYDSNLNVGWILDFSLNGTKNTIVDLIIYIFGLMMMVMLMKSCIVSNTGIKFIDDKMSNLSKSLWWDKEFGWILWSVGVIPVRDKNGEVHKMGINSMRKLGDNMVGGDADSNWETWARRMWFSISKQDELVNKFLWQATSFASLSAAMSKQEFVSRAIEIWKDMWYNSPEKIYADPGLEKKMREWGKNPKNVSKQIFVSDFKTVWDGGTLDENKWEWTEEKTEPEPKTE